MLYNIKNIKSFLNTAQHLLQLYGLLIKRGLSSNTFRFDLYSQLFLPMTMESRNLFSNVRLLQSWIHFVLNYGNHLKDNYFPIPLTFEVDEHLNEIYVKIINFPVVV